MTDGPMPKPYEWADEIFSDAYDIHPKYRDMLAMLASAMRDDPDAARHFYHRAQGDGANEEELRRIVQIVQSSRTDIEAPLANAQSE